MAIFEDRVTVERPREEVFEFFRVICNHEKMSAGHLGLVFTSAPERFEHGSQLEFQIQGLGQVQNAVHEIIAYDPPERYVEQQIKGPMKSWRHEHLFIAEGDQTIVVDQIEFEPPGGLLGFIATESRILQSLEDGIYSRNLILKDLLENGAPDAT